ARVDPYPDSRAPRAPPRRARSPPRGRFQRASASWVASAACRVDERLEDRPLVRQEAARHVTRPRDLRADDPIVREPPRDRLDAREEVLAVRTPDGHRECLRSRLRRRRPALQELAVELRAIRQARAPRIERAREPPAGGLVDRREPLPDVIAEKHGRGRTTDG